MRTATDMADLMHYDDLCARLYNDSRLPTGTRQLMLALAWVALRDPARGEQSSWRRAAKLLGGSEAARKLVYEDRPRYEPPGQWSGPCDGPRYRPYRPRAAGGRPAVYERYPVKWSCEGENQLALKVIR